MKKWWNQLLGRRKPEKKVNVSADIDALVEFLADIPYDAKELLAKFKKLQELEKEYEMASSGILHINLETQAKLLDKLLEQYEFFENDVDVNGLRMKLIAREFLKRASKAGMSDLVRQKEKDKRWMMLW
ncbi:MAG: hypothetical protein AABW53_02385 [Nanoarchaeota archaeon]